MCNNTKLHIKEQPPPPVGNSGHTVFDGDVDILVDFDNTPTLFGFVRLENELSRLLGVKVDLVMKTGLKPALGARILAEAIAV
jgi:predicted nucleotidyltransferase